MNSIIYVFCMYMFGSICRGLLIVAIIAAFELVWRRKLMFAGLSKIYFLLFILAVLPCGVIDFSSFYRPAAVTLPVAAAPAPVMAAEVKKDSTAPANPMLSTAAVYADSTAAQIAENKMELLELAPVSEPSGQLYNWLYWGMSVYFLLALVLLAKRFRQFIFWRGRIRRCIAITDGREYELFVLAKQKLGINSKIALLDSGKLFNSPASFNCLPGKMLLCPRCETAKLTDAELEMLLIHELGHLKNSDNLAVFLSALLTNLLWPNVFLRFLLNRFAFARELECDALVRQQAGAKNATYAKLLLYFQANSNQIPVAGLSTAAADLKLRIEEFAMKNHLKNKNLLIGTISALALSVALLSPVIPLAAQENEAENSAAVPQPASVDLFPEAVLKHIPLNSRALFSVASEDFGQIVFTITSGRFTAILKQYPSISRIVVAMSEGEGESDSSIIMFQSDKPFPEDSNIEPIGDNYYIVKDALPAANTQCGLSDAAKKTLAELPAGVRSFVWKDKDSILYYMVPEKDGNLLHIQVAVPPGARANAKESIADMLKFWAKTLNANSNLPPCKVEIEGDLVVMHGIIPSRTTAELEFLNFTMDISGRGYDQFRNYTHVKNMLDLPGGREILTKYVEDCKQKLLSGQYDPEINGYPGFFMAWGIATPDKKRAVAAKLLMSDYNKISFYLDPENGKQNGIELFEELEKSRPEMAVYAADVMIPYFAYNKLELAAKYCPEPYKAYKNLADNTIPYMQKTKNLDYAYSHYMPLMAKAEVFIKIAEYQKNEADVKAIKAGMDEADAVIKAIKATLPPAPEVVEITPANGALNVSCHTKELVVKFNKAMKPGSWSFCQNSDYNFPGGTGKTPHYSTPDTVVFPLKELEPNTKYDLWLNMPPYINFKSADGGVLESYHYTFTTGPAEP